MRHHQAFVLGRTLETLQLQEVALGGDDSQQQQAAGGQHAAAPLAGDGQEASMDGEALPADPQVKRAPGVSGCMLRAGTS